MAYILLLPQLVLVSLTNAVCLTDCKGNSSFLAMSLAGDWKIHILNSA